MSLGIIWFSLHLAALQRYPVVTCDEAFYVQSAGRYTASVLQQESWPTTAGRLFYMPHSRSYWLLLGISADIFGAQLLAGRLISLLSLVGLVAATYWLGTRLSSRSHALWAAGLVGVSWLAFYSGHLTRPDMLAAAMSTLMIGAWYTISARREWWWYIVLGFGLCFQVELHLIVVHMAWPVMLLSLVDLLRNQAWKRLIGLLTGAVIGAIVIGWLHLGDSTAVLLRLLFADPGATLYSFVGSGGSPPNLFDVLFELIESLADFWWRHYAWHMSVASLPQAALFIVGLISASRSRERRLRLLALMILLSSLSFMLVNTRTNYTLFGYSLLWLPLYMVLGVIGLQWLVERLPFTGLKPWIPHALLAVLAALYVAGDVYFTVKFWDDSYSVSASEITDDMQPGSRVLSSRVWWFSFPETLVFIDEDLVFPTQSNAWWNTVPQGEFEVEAPLELPRRDNPSKSESYRLVQAKLEDLRPDYIVVDTVMGCDSNPREPAGVLSEYAAEHCSAVEVVDPTVKDLALHYDTQTIYACTWK